MSAILARYPDDVILAVTDPNEGLVSTQPNLPALAEIKAACEAKMAWSYRERQRWQAQQDAYLLTAPAVEVDEAGRERATAAWGAIRASVIAARPMNEELQAPVTPPVLETPQQVLDRVKNAGPVKIGAELRAKLDGYVAARDQDQVRKPKRRRKAAA